VAQGAAPFHFGNVPGQQLACLWSEPPIAVIGLAAGSPAVYARPFQFVDCYEHDQRIIRFSQPPADKEPFFHYLHSARQRGAEVRIFQGEERQTLAVRGPKGFYHVMILELCISTRTPMEEIYVDLLTREGMALCFECLAEDGVLCVHTSHRYVKMPPVIADVARSLGLVYKVGRDMGEYYDPQTGINRELAFTSEWVMVARHERALANLREPPGYKPNPANKDPYWSVPPATGKYAWTDHGFNSCQGLFRDDPLISSTKQWIQRTAFDLTQHLTGPIRDYQTVDRGIRMVTDHWSMHLLNRTGVTLRESVSFRPSFIKKKE
jgi:hypothetical protein